MLILSEKKTLEPAREPDTTAFAHMAWLGECLRQIVLFPVLRIFVSITVHATHKLVGTGPYIFAANHSSHLDAPVLLAALPLRLRMQTRIAAAADYFFTRRWAGLLVGLFLNAFPFERKQPGSAASLAYTARLLQQGQSLLIFPEGTRSRDGQMQRFRSGIGRIALGSGVSIVPVWIDGTFAALPKGAKWPRRQAISVRFGAPLRCSYSDDPITIAAAVEQAVHALALDK